MRPPTKSRLKEKIVKEKAEKTEKAEAKRRKAAAEIIEAIILRRLRYFYLTVSRRCQIGKFKLAQIQVLVGRCYARPLCLGGEHGRSGDPSIAAYM